MNVRSDQFEAQTETELGFRFLRFLVLPSSRRIFADERPLRLGSRAFELLLALLEADGAPVSREQLVMRVWPGEPKARANLDTQIAILRRVLDPDRDAIATVRGGGYRLAAHTWLRMEGWEIGEHMLDEQGKAAVLAALRHRCPLCQRAYDAE